MPAQPASTARVRGLALLVAVAVAVGAGWVVAGTGAFGSLEAQSVEARFALRHVPPPDDVAVVGVDDASLDSLGRQWPFPRSWHARVVDRLHRAGARLIVYDVQFTEPTRPREDEALYEALRRAGGGVLATAEMTRDGRTNVLGGDANLARIGARAGAATLSDDRTGLRMRLPYAHSGLPTLAVAAVEEVTGRPVPRRGFGAGGAWIDYRGAPGAIDTLSFASVMRGDFDPRRVRNRIVVVGATNPTLQDVHATPVSEAPMAGPEVQANAIWTVLHGVPLRPVPRWVDLLLPALLGLLPAVVRLRRRVLGTILVAPVAALAFLAGAQLAFAQGAVVGVVAPLVALGLGTVGTVVASHLTETRERRWLSRHSELLERTVRERTEELRRTQLEVLERLAHAAESRDGETGEHIRRIGALAERVGLALGMSAAEAELLRHASALHDVGKVAIPDGILLKPGRLTAEEWEIMKSHAAAGAALLAGSESPLVQRAEEIARTHHERWDGTGYPAGLRGEQIPLAGRICAVVDVFDALRSERPYKRAWSLEDTLAELRRGRGAHFDARVVDAFLPIAESGDREVREGTVPWQATTSAAAAAAGPAARAERPRAPAPAP